MNTVSGVVKWLTDSANWHGSDGVPVRTLEHLRFSMLSLAIVIVIALPLALWLGHIRRGGFVAVNVTNIGRAIPTFALLTVLALTSLGVSWKSLVLALVLFGIPPVLTNAYVGVREVDQELVEAARGMGMTGFQQLWRVELPLAMPLILNGIRLAAVQIVATMTIASLVAGPGLGRIISEGFATQNKPELEAGGLLVVVLALLVEGAFAWLQRRLDPVRRAHRVTSAPPPASPDLLAGVDLTPAT
ncbi:MAG: osmoprotectant transport system permease protein [Actinomycetota bacterium]|nr:osmoprotectant transport system permease protein [Actinomycetota bacterium]